MHRDRHGPWYRYLELLLAFLWSSTRVGLNFRLKPWNKNRCSLRVRHRYLLSLQRPLRDESALPTCVTCHSFLRSFVLCD